MTNGITIDQASHRLASATGHHRNQDYNLQRAANAYVYDKLTIEQLERAVEHILLGGYLSEALEPRSPLMDRVRRRRLQLKCSHPDVLDISGFDRQIHVCATCGLDVTDTGT